MSVLQGSDSMIRQLRLSGSAMNYVSFSVTPRTERKCINVVGSTLDTSVFQHCIQRDI